MRKKDSIFVKFFQFCSKNAGDLLILSGLSLFVSGIYLFNAILGQILFGLVVFTLGLIIARK